MDNTYGQDYQIVLKELVKSILEKMPVIIVVFLISAAIGWSFSTFLIVPQYEASINMIVNTRIGGSGNVTNDNISSAQNLVDTYAVIIKSNTVLNKVISDLDLNLDYEELYEMLSVEDIDHTQIMKIAVQSNNQEINKQIVQTISQIAPPIVANAVEAGSCKVVSDVYVSDTPITPNVMKNTIISAGAGSIIYLAILILKVLMNDFITDDTDMGKKIGIPVLAIIPNLED